MQDELMHSGLGHNAHSHSIDQLDRVHPLAPLKGQNFSNANEIGQVSIRPGYFDPQPILEPKQVV